LLWQPAAERPQDSIEHQVEFPPHVFRQNPKDEVVVLLKELVLASVPSVSCSVREMLGAVQLDRDARIGAEQIDLQPTLAVEWNWERDVETKSPLGFRERLEPPEKERLRRTPRSIDTVGVLGERSSSVHEEARQRRIDSVSDQSADTA
jgi:hypothetical protein